MAYRESQRYSEPPFPVWIVVVVAIAMSLFGLMARGEDAPAVSFDEWFSSHKQTCHQCSKGPDEPICEEAFERLKPSKLEGTEVGRPFDGHIIENRKVKHPDRWDESGKWKFPLFNKGKNAIVQTVESAFKGFWGMLELPFTASRIVGYIGWALGGLCCFIPFLLLVGVVTVAFFGMLKGR